MTVLDTLAADRICPGCGYDLRATPAGRCPECGIVVDDVASGHLAWEQRHKLGRVRAFLRTTRDATFRHERLARAVVGPVDVPAAKLYRRIVLAIATASVAALQIAFLVTITREPHLFPDAWSDFYPPNSSELVVVLNTGGRFAPAVPMAFLAVFCIGTAVAPWFRTGDRSLRTQNRAMAVSFYTCGPLVWLAVPAALALILLVVDSFPSLMKPSTSRSIATGLCLAAEIWTVFALPAIFVSPVRTDALLSQGGYLRVVGMTVVIAVQWTLAAFIGLGLVSFFVGLVFLMVTSFWN